MPPATNDGADRPAQGGATDAAAAAQGQANPQSKVDTPLVDDLVKFLKQQPGNALRGTKLGDFYRAHPSYKGTGIKLKVLAGKHPSRLRWVPGATEALHKVTLAGASEVPSSPVPTTSAPTSALVPVPTEHRVLEARIQQLVDANLHGSWTATKLDKEYRKQFGVEEGWWTALGVTAATDAFRKFPGIIVARSRPGKGIHFVKAPRCQEQPELRAHSQASAGAPLDNIAKNLLKIIPVAPGEVEIGTLGSQYMSKFKVALTQALGSVKLSVSSFFGSIISCAQSSP